MFSYQLVQEYKKAKGIKTDLEASTHIAGLNSGNISQVKSGKRKLTEEQALFIAHECNLNPEWVLVHLAEEVSKYEEAKQVWSNLAKKISRSATAAILAAIVIFGGLDVKQADSPVLA